MTDTNAQPNAATDSGQPASATAAITDVKAAAPATDANAAKDTALTDKAATAPADKAADPAAKPADAKDPAANADGKKDDAKPADAKTDDKKPEGETLKDYTDFTLPDTITVNPETMTEFATLAKKHGLSQEAAQEFASLGAKVVEKTDEAVITAFADLTAKVTKEWEGESKADKEFGGAELDANLSVAKAAVDEYASPELKAILGKYDKTDNPNGTGLGNNPEIIRLFYRIGKTISSDTTFVEGKGGSDTPNLSPGDRLWGKK